MMLKKQNLIESGLGQAIDDQGAIEGHGVIEDHQALEEGKTLTEVERTDEIEEIEAHGGEVGLGRLRRGGRDQERDHILDPVHQEETEVMDDMRRETEVFSAIFFSWHQIFVSNLMQIAGKRMASTVEEALIEDIRLRSRISLGV